MVAPKPFAYLDRVSVVRNGQRVFEELTLSLSERRIGLIGNNGSGKSTLLRLMAGLLRPDRGTVSVEGVATAHGRPNTGFLFQNPDHQILFPTVGEEISFGLIEGGMDAAAAEARVRLLLARHRCGGWDKRAVHELSEGQKQLVCLVAVLACDPSLILLDEPFSSLDLPTRIDLKHRLLGLDQHLIMASHDFDLLREFDRVLWIHEGSVLGDGYPRDVIAAYEGWALGDAGRAKIA